MSDLAEFLQAGTRTIGNPFVIAISNEAGQPLAGVPVWLGERVAATDVHGEALFLGLENGSYDARIDVVDYRPLRQPVKVQPSRRSCGLTLAAAQIGSVRGRVTVATAALPLPNARITFTPAAPGEMGAGPMTAFADWDGVYEVRTMPAGKYMVDVKADGCRASRFEFTVGPELLTLDHALTHQPDPAEIRVKVTYEDGQSVGPCTVRLLAGTGARILAQKKCRGSCTFTFERGPFNAVDDVETGFLGADFVLVAEPASGHPASCPVSVRSDAQVEVTVVCARAGADLSIPLPGDGSVTSIPLDEALGVALAPGAVKRLLRIALPQPAQLKATAGPNPFLTRVRLLDEKMTVVAETWNHPNCPAEVVGAFRAGGVFIEVSGDTGDAAKPVCALRVASQWIVDGAPWNSEPDAALPVRFGEVLYPCLFPCGDAAWFSVEIHRPGVLRVRARRCPVAARVRLLDADEAELAGNWNHANCDIELVRTLLAPGRYRVAMEALNPGSDYALSAAELRLDFLDADSAPADHDAQRVPPVDLMVGRWSPFTLFPERRVCRGRWRFERSGHLKLRVRIADCATKVVVRDPAETVVFQNWNHPGTRIEADIQVPRAGTYEIDLTGLSADGMSLRAGAVLACFHPNDEYEGAGNGTLESAADIHLGQVVAGGIGHAGDVDCYRFVADTPGLLRVRTGLFPVALSLTILDEGGQKLYSNWNHAGTTLEPEVHLARPGCYYLQLQPLSAGDYAPSVYRFTLELVRVRPAQPALLAGMALPPGTGVHGDALLPGHVLKFSVSAPTGAARIGARLPTAASLVITDSAGVERFNNWNHAGLWCEAALALDTPTTLQCVLRARGDQDWSRQPYFLYAAPGPRPPEAKLSMVRVAEDGLTVDFALAASPADGLVIERCEIDFNGDGKFEAVEAASFSHRYRSKGLHPVRARVVDSRGAIGLDDLWLDRRDVVLDRLACQITWPDEESTIAAPQPVRAIASSGPGKPVAEVKLELDGRPIGRSVGAVAVATPDWNSLSAERHQLVATAVDRSGRTVQATVRFHVAGVFDLWPADGQVLSGTRAIVSWRSPGTAASVVEYRATGTDEWRRAVGVAGRAHRVVLDELAFGVPCEFRAGDGRVMSETRILTLQKGLGFTQARFGARIARSYDQTVAVTVVNHSDTDKETVLECLHEKDGELLVSFVGDGSPEHPVILHPGETRQFALGLSAQDCVQPLHRFPVVIRSADGYSDRAEVEVSVAIPRVELAWEELEENAATLGRKLRLANRGDALTDLTVSVSPSGAFRVRPAVHHAACAAGESVELWVEPVLFDGFERVEGAITAGAVGQAVPHPLRCAVPPGQQVHEIRVDPTFVDAIASWYCTNRPEVKLLLQPLSYLEKTLIGEQLKSLNDAAAFCQWLRELQQMYVAQEQCRGLARDLLKELPFFRKTPLGEYLTQLTREMGLDPWLNEALHDAVDWAYPWVQCHIGAAVGRGDPATVPNRAEDVLTVQRRLKGLGFYWVDESGTMDGKTDWAIRLFQAMALVSGTTSDDRKFTCQSQKEAMQKYLEGKTTEPPKDHAGCDTCTGGLERFDGNISLTGPTLKWLQDPNAPGWMRFPAGSDAAGYKLDHNCGRPWGSTWAWQVQTEANRHYLATYFVPQWTKMMTERVAGLPPLTPYPPPLTVNSVAKVFGGNRCLEGSDGHQSGLDLDLGLPRRADGTVNDEALIAMLDGYVKSGQVTKMLYNDEAIQARFPGIISSWPRHGDHVHIVINKPDPVKPQP